jgi:very-short-patch-repair endonuclease
MDNKVEYITRLFQKTSSKAIENYCLTRLWHKLDNDEIKIIPQQYVGIHSDKYALTDVYLPQFKLHIEVNEPAHYISIERILADEKRKQKIEKNTGHKLLVIDCRLDLKVIHKQIDNIATEINNLVTHQKKNGTFKPWQPDIESNPEHWKNIGTIKTADEIWFSNIEDICKLFDADFNKTKRGFQRLGGIFHPNSNTHLLWWPSEKTRRGWLNTLSQDEQEIIETHSDSKTKEEHYNKYLNSQQKRIVFFHHRDILGLTSYKFKGVFAYDNIKSSPSVGSVWKKVENELIIKLDD